MEDESYDALSSDRELYELVVSEVANDEVWRIVFLASFTLRIITAFSSSVITRVDASKTAVAGMATSETSEEDSETASDCSDVFVTDLVTAEIASIRDCVDCIVAPAEVAVATDTSLVLFFETVLTTFLTNTSATMAIAAAYAGVAYSIEHANSAPERNHETTMRNTVSVTAATVLKGL